MLMGMDIPEDEFQLDEMNISAICEVMNQMMGASATALSELLGRFIDITPPKSFEVEGEQGFKDKYFDETEPMVIVGFSIQISGKMNSEFKNLMSVELAKELVAGFFAESPMAFSLDLLDEGGSTTHADPKPAQAQTKQEEKKMGDEKMETQTPIAQGLHTEANSQVQSQTGSDVVGGAGSMQSQPEQSQSKPSNDSLASVSSTPLPVFDPQMFAQGAGCDQQLMSSISMMIDTMREQIRTQQQQMDQLMQLRQGGNKKIKVDQPTKNTLDRSGNQMASMLDVEENMELIKTVPLDISVEIGRTKKLVKDILELNKGSLVVLDKLAGEEVDVFANGQCIAKGDVVVVDDNFAIRITEILTEEITSIG
jgi:flagellar motor switch protein FliN/FliY